jgi:hypothetical protein
MRAGCGSTQFRRQAANRVKTGIRSRRLLAARLSGLA